ncbi:hypothetical protein L798_06441 [Zootermopsis nevadensis]|uniref:Uncharacterized protein n=1 Tax=Zootermopsis nevadensis TaxID=136037 RepID=A0A067RF63_ZOONE|nr:hypothetical protein L798_06441 [Zootermopsis nevadensis]
MWEFSLYCTAQLCAIFANFSTQFMILCDQILDKGLRLLCLSICIGCPEQLLNKCTWVGAMIDMSVDLSVCSCYHGAGGVGVGGLEMDYSCVDFMGNVELPPLDEDPIDLNGFSSFSDFMQSYKQQ